MKLFLVSLVLGCAALGLVSGANAQISPRKGNPAGTHPLSGTNAYDIWVGVSDRFQLPADKGLTDALYAACDFGSPLTNMAGRAKLERWLDSLQGAFATVSAGIDLGRLQFPPLVLEDVPTREFTAFRQIARCKMARARLSMEAGRDRNAAEELFDTVTMGQLIMGGSGALIHYLVGGAIQGMGVDGVRAMANDARVSVGTLQWLLDRFPDAPGGDILLAEAFRAERSTYIEQSLSRIEQYLLSPTNGPPVPLSADVYDRASTGALLDEVFGRWVANATNLWTARDRHIESDLNRLAGYKPGDENDVFLAFAMTCGDTNNLANYWKQLTKEARTNPNILGKRLAAMEGCGDAALEKFVRMHAEWNIVRTLLALSIYERQIGKTPETLDELVSGGILPCVPQDLFAGKPLLFSKAKGIVWSVGPDERDNHGDRDNDIVRSFRSIHTPR